MTVDCAYMGGGSVSYMRDKWAWLVRALGSRMGLGETFSAVSWPGPEEGCPIGTSAVDPWRLVSWAEEGLCAGSNSYGGGGEAEVCVRPVRTVTEGLGDSSLFSVCPRKVEAQPVPILCPGLLAWKLIGKEGVQGSRQWPLPFHHEEDQCCRVYSTRRSY